MTNIYRFQTWAANTVAGSPVKKAILMALAYIADWETGRCEAKHETLAKYVEVSEAAISRNLKEMESAGLIDRRAQYRADNSRRGNQYLLLAPGVTEWPDGLPTTSQRTGAPTARSDVDPPRAPDGVHHAPQTGQEQPLVEQPLGNNRLQLHIGGENGDGPTATAPKPKIPCWDLSPTDGDFEPSYTGLDPHGVEVAVEDGVAWVDAPPERVVLDFWRDLHWHMDAEMTPSKREAIKTALQHYPVRMVCRAIAAGLKDPWIQGEEGRGPFDKLETMIAVTSKRDNVDRLSCQVSDDELSKYLIAAGDNRLYISKWRAEDWATMDEVWRVKNRHRLQRDSQSRYHRFLKWQAEQGAAVAS